MTCEDCVKYGKRNWKCKLGFHDFDNDKCRHEEPIECNRDNCGAHKDFGLDYP